MPVYTSEALILRTYKLGEADRIVVFLTRDRGKKRGVAKGARRAKSRFLGALEARSRAAVALGERLGRFFEYGTLRLRGVYPTLSACPGCVEPFTDGAVMPPKDDLLVCRQCAQPAGGMNVGVEALRFLRAAGGA